MTTKSSTASRTPEYLKGVEGEIDRSKIVRTKVPGEPDGVKLYRAGYIVYDSAKTVKEYEEGVMINRNFNVKR